MRALVYGSLVLLPLVSILAQDKSQDEPGKIEVTYSLVPQEMYKTWCATCHGLSGKGDGPAASALKKKPADLTLLSKKNGGKFPVERVRNYIEGKDAKTDAHGSREMPIWGNVFMDLASSPVAVTYRVTSLASYVETLQAK
jgi:mono/diheme cytochrome c family protein